MDNQSIPIHEEISLKIHDRLYVKNISDDTPNQTISFNDNKLCNVAVPTEAHDAANKEYVDNIANLNVGNNAKYFDGYDGIGELSLIPINQYYDIRITNQRSIDNDAYDHKINDSHITILEEATYIIFGRVSTYISSGSIRTQSSMRLLRNGQEIPGSISYMYNREVIEGYNTGCSWIIQRLNKYDKISMQAKLNSGSNSLRTVKDGSSISIFKIEGLQGPIGPIGSTGKEGQTGNIVWRGQYNKDNVVYNKNELVHYDGSVYISNKETLMEPSITAKDWEIFVKKGNNGSGININIKENNTILPNAPFNSININTINSPLRISNNTVTSIIKPNIIPEIIKLRTTTKININELIPIKIPWTITDMLTNVNSYSLNPATTDITVKESGIYEIYVNLVFETIVQRFNGIVKITKNSVNLFGSARSGYIRSASNHNQSSASFQTIEELKNNDNISITVQREAAKGDVRLISGESCLIVKRLDTKLY